MIQQLPPHARIAAILPCYSASGDSTAIIATDGTITTLSSRIRAVVHRLARSQAVDLPALKANTTAVTQRAILQALPLAPGLVLVPVKVRQPRVAGDTTTGYLNLTAVTRVQVNKTKPYQSTVELSGKAQVPILWTVVTVNKQLALARLAAVNGPQTLPAISGSGSWCESHPGYTPALANLAVKLIDIFNDILLMKQRDR